MPAHIPAATLTARQRRPKVAELYLTGKTQAFIADELGVGQATISRDLKAIQEEWAKSAIFDFNEAVGQELARIDNLERTYWQAWFDSRKPAETKASQLSEKHGKTSSVQTHDRQVGDKRFLEGVQWCIEQRVKLMGLAAPERISISWQDNLPEEFKGKADEVQRQFAEMLAMAAQCQVEDEHDSSD